MTHPSSSPARSGARNVLLLIILATILISVQYAPSVLIQRRDSGIFAYTGQIVLEGGLPYVDAWDNKLPNIFYLNAAAFVVFGVNRWAIWIMDTGFVGGAALILFGLLMRVYRWRDLAWIGALLLVMLARHMAIVPDTNFTEIYALLPQLVVWAAGWQFLQKPGHRSAFVIGAAAGVALLLKQTTIGEALALVPAALIVRPALVREKCYWRWLGTMIAGGWVVLGTMALLLAGYGILDDAIRASFLSASAFHDWVGRGTPWIGATIAHSLLTPELWIAYGPLLPFMVIGVWGVIRDRATSDPARTTFDVWVILALIGNLALANITDRAYEHYYVSLIPAVVLLVARGLASIRNQPFTTRSLRYLIALTVLIPLGTTIWRFDDAGWDVIGPARVDPLAAYVAAQTMPDERVFVWGANTLVNFQSQRQSPTAYTYGYALIVPGADSKRHIATVIADLNATPPALIVDSTWTDGRRIPPLDPIRRAAWEADGGRSDVADLAPIYDFVAERCILVDEIEEAMIYRCR